jgi:uncharacterized membrane protein
MPQNSNHKVAKDAETNGFSVGDAIGVGWERFTQYPGILIGSLLFVQIISLGLTFLPGLLGDQPALVLVYNLIALFVLMGLTVGFVQLLISAHDNSHPHFTQLFSGFDKRLLSFFAAALLVGVAVALGLVLLIIPGVYLLLGLFFWQYPIVEDSLGPVEAMKYSWRITKGGRLNLLGFLAVSFFINMVGLVLLGVGLLVSAPTTALATVYIYRQLQTQDEKSPKKPPESNRPATN